MDSELTASERSQLIEFARSTIERARQAGLPSAESTEEPRALPLRDELDPKTMIELLSQYRRFFDKTRAQLARELDAVLLVVERLEREIAVLRGEVLGLRQERQEFLSRLRRSEQELGAAAEEFARQISDEVAGLAGRLTSYIDDVGRAATAPARPPAAPSERERDEANGAHSSPAPGLPALNGDARTEPATPPPVAAGPMATASEAGESKRARQPLLGLVRRRIRKPGRADTANAEVIASADRARNARDWEAAARLYRQALEMVTENAAIWVQYGHALKECGNKPEAESAYRKAIALEPNVADTHLQLGHVLKLQRKQAAAAAAYLHAIALDPGLQDATNELLGLGWTEARIRRALH